MTDINDMPGYLIRRLHQISVAIFTARTAEAGFDLTPVQYGALATVNRYPGIDQVTLAGCIAYDKATIGGVVDRLIQKGYLKRDVSPSDRRARVLELTDEGRAVLEAATPIVAEVQDQSLSGLSEDEARTLLDLLKKATDAGNSLSRAPLRAAPQPK